MYKRIYNMYKRIFMKLLDYYKHVLNVIELGYSSSGLNNGKIYGSKFGLKFIDPCNLKDLRCGNIGSSDNTKIKAYYYDCNNDKHNICYIELVCDRTGLNLTNKNLSKMGCDICANTEPFINIMKLKYVIEKYLCFYKKIISEMKKKINITKDIKQIKKIKMDNDTISSKSLSISSIKEKEKDKKKKKKKKCVVSSESSLVESYVSTPTLDSCSLSDVDNKINIFKK